MLCTSPIPYMAAAYVYGPKQKLQPTGYCLSDIGEMRSSLFASFSTSCGYMQTMARRTTPLQMPSSFLIPDDLSPLETFYHRRHQKQRRTSTIPSLMFPICPLGLRGSGSRQKISPRVNIFG